MVTVRVEHDGAVIGEAVIERRAGECVAKFTSASGVLTARVEVDRDTDAWSLLTALLKVAESE